MKNRKRTVTFGKVAAALTRPERLQLFDALVMNSAGGNFLHKMGNGGHVFWMKIDSAAVGVGMRANYVEEVSGILDVVASRLSGVAGGREAQIDVGHFRFRFEQTEENTTHDVILTISVVDVPQGKSPIWEEPE